MNSQNISKKGSDNIKSDKINHSSQVKDPNNKNLITNDLSINTLHDNSQSIQFQVVMNMDVSLNRFGQQSSTQTLYNAQILQNQQNPNNLSNINNSCDIQLYQQKDISHQFINKRQNQLALKSQLKKQNNKYKLVIQYQQSSDQPRESQIIYSAPMSIQSVSAQEKMMSNSKRQQQQKYKLLFQNSILHQASKTDPKLITYLKQEESRQEFINMLEDINQISAIIQNEFNSNQNRNDFINIESFDNISNASITENQQKRQQLSTTLGQIDISEMQSIFGNIDKLQYKYGNALQHFKTSLEKIKQANQFKTQKCAKILISMGQTYDGLQQTLQALECFLNAKIIYQQINKENDYDIGFLYNKLGIAYRDLKLFKQSEHYTKLAIQVTQKTRGQNSLQLASVTMNMGIVFKEMNQFDKALQQYQKCIKIVVNNQNGKQSSIYVKILMNKSNIYYYRQDFDKSLEFSLQAIQIYQRIQNQYNYQKGVLYFTIGSLLINKQQYQKGLIYLDKAEHIVEKLNLWNTYLAESTYNNKSSCYIYLGDIPKAQQYLKRFSQLLQTSKSLNVVWLKKIIIVNYARLYLLKKNYIQAQQNISKAYQFFKNQYGIQHYFTKLAKKQFDIIKQQKQAINKQN